MRGLKKGVDPPRLPWPTRCPRKQIPYPRIFTPGNCIVGISLIPSSKLMIKGLQPTPFAVVLSCSDSRVPPEHVFDQGLGDIFVIRVAGNIADPIALGSIEYALEHLGVPLVLVLGHQSCGAVKATVAGGKPEGNIGAIVKKIAPAVKEAKAKVKDKDKVLDAAILQNTKNTAMALMKNSAIIKHLVEGQKVKIAAGVYRLTTGKVELVDLSPGGKKSKN